MATSYYHTLAAPAVRQTDAAAEPLDLGEAKQHSRIDIEEDDIYIYSLVKRARMHVENMTRRALISQTWTVYHDDFVSQMYIPRPPLISVQSVQYKDTEDSTQTVASTVYTVDTNSTPGRVFEKTGQGWPSTLGDPQSAWINYTAGYGTSGTDVPEPIKHAMLILIEHWYDLGRQPVIVQPGATSVKVDFTINALLEPYIVKVFL